MGDMGEYFRDLKEHNKDHKENNLESNMKYLNDIEADYEVHNKGYQLNFETHLGTIAFYPSTNKWVLNSKTYYGNAQNLVNWVFSKLQFFDWVKKLGQWHLYKSGSSETICGKPMLGNNYYAHIPFAQREKCEKCFKGVTI